MSEKKCKCPKVDCERHGKCGEYVAFHRDVAKNVVFCLKDLAAKPAEAAK